MKKAVLGILALLFIQTGYSQQNINDLIAAGVADAQRFSADYLAPATEGVAFGMNNGWFNSGKAPHLFGVEVSIIGNVSFIKDEHKSFELNTADYENIAFTDGSTSKNVATALGHNDPEIVVEITYDDPIFGEQTEELTLPTGIGSQKINVLPTAFLQASFSPLKGMQLKGRFFPKVDQDDVKVGFYGVGLQQDFTKLLPADKLMPVALSALVAYAHLDGSYDFEDGEYVEGDNQRIETATNTMLFEAIVSTKLKVINFYGGLGYITGKSNTDLLGTYRVDDGLITSEAITDPFSIEQNISGMLGTVGANLKLGFFGLNVDYTLAKFNSASLGLNFSF